jgi:RHH-type proline utilization regulon transcriptional repressor/proline dehydrogenase/delta 1-pyrroline-5-carboxylate dehydrogenase
MASAFGYQGQKCSACSRVIVHADCYDRFLARMCEAVKGFKVGPPEDRQHDRPLIDGAAKERVQAAIELGRREGKVAAEIPVPGQGFYVSRRSSPIFPRTRRSCGRNFRAGARRHPRGDIEEAVGLANSSDYALTGGLFSRSPATIGRVRETFAVGNLYINRGITGALVGRQPFGGFRMSGVGSKAGGPDYLLQFMEPRVITENTMRRGFSPDVLL